MGVGHIYLILVPQMEAEDVWWVDSPFLFPLLPCHFAEVLTFFFKKNLQPFLLRDRLFCVAFKDHSLCAVFYTCCIMALVFAVMQLCFEFCIISVHSILLFFFIFFSHYIFVLFLFNPIRYKQIFFLIKKCRFSMTTESANDKWQNNTVEQQKIFNALIQLLFWFVSSSTEARSVLSCFFPPSK